ASNLARADHQFAAAALVREGYVENGVHHPGYELMPSEIFHRQCYPSGWFEPVAPFAPYLGIEHLLWSTNMPLATSTWPRTAESIGRCFEGIAPEARDQVLWKNAASLYKLNGSSTVSS